MKGILLILLAAAAVSALVWHRMRMGGRSPNASLVVRAFEPLAARPPKVPPKDGPGPLK